MKVLFYDTKPYDKDKFEKALQNIDGIEFTYTEDDLDKNTARLSSGFDAICVFVSSDVNKEVIDELNTCGVKLILLRCAGYNNVDLEYAHKLGITVMNVPGYSPESVAEHGMALALSVNRKIHKAYNRVRENDFSLNGLLGINLYGKTAGIIGTGRIGEAFARICKGFGMDILFYDMYENPRLSTLGTYVDLDTLISSSDLISLHCPLNENTRHLINLERIKQMKDGVILINTSRGGLINTADLIDGIRLKKFGGVGLDVYEEEDENVFEDRSNDILAHSTTNRLLSFPNVIITSHQGFFTKEALLSIANTTIQNALDFKNNIKSNQICPICTR